MPSLPRILSPFRSRRRRFVTSLGDDSAADALVVHDEEDNQLAGSEAEIKAERLRAALCTFLNIDEGRQNADYIHRYIRTFCTASAVMGDPYCLVNIFTQSEVEFHSTLAICRLISEQFELEIDSQPHYTAQALPENTASDSDTCLSPARKSAIINLPHQRFFLPIDSISSTTRLAVQSVSNR
jgi:hypothetical protein